MDQSTKVTYVKNELSDSTSTCRIEIPNEKQIKSVKKESDCLVHSEIRIKTEPQEDYSESPVVAVTSYEMCPNYNVKVETDEPMVKFESKKIKNEIMDDPLNVSGETNEGQIFLGKHFLDTEKNLDSFGSGSNNQAAEDDFENMIGESEEEKNLLTSNENNLDTSNNDGQKLQKKRGRKKIYENYMFSCHLCQKIFTHRGNLNKHLRCHTGEKPYSCDICQKSFGQKDTLVTHMLIHRDEKPYSCDVCAKLFRQRADLSKHKLIHTGAKPFSCSECNKTFRQKHHLVQHKRTHTGDKPFSCDLCNETFMFNSTFNRHKCKHAEDLL